MKSERPAILALYSLLLCGARADVTISPDHPELLQQEINAAYAAGQKSVVVSPGIYQIPFPGGFHLIFRNMKDFEIDARGATFVFQAAGIGIAFSACENVTLRGATMYYATLPFSQGVVRATADDSSSLEVQIEKGYPTNLDDPKYFPAQLLGHVFDSGTRLFKRNVRGDFVTPRTQRLNEDTFRIFPQQNAGVAVGDLVALAYPGQVAPLWVSKSSRMNLVDVTILNSPGGAVVELNGGATGANVYRSLVVARGPVPAGASTEPLLSTNSNGFLVQRSRSGPDIEDCWLEAMFDDGFDLAGSFSQVMEGSSGNTVVVSDTITGGANFAVGDHLFLMNEKDEPAGQAVVTAVTALPAYSSNRKSARHLVFDLTQGPYFEITLDQPLKADFDYLASNTDASAAGFILRNNTVKNHRGRGLNLKADDGIAEGNTIDGSSWIGIRIGPEITWGSGSGSGFGRNLIIRNNTIRNVGYVSGIPTLAGLIIGTNEGIPPEGSFQNIVIDGNTFADFDGIAAFISSASGVVISNNTFRHLQDLPPAAPPGFGEPVNPGTLIYVTKTDPIQFTGNTTVDMGRLNTLFLQRGGSLSVAVPADMTFIADANADFSGVQGGNQWSYGYFPAGDLTAFTPLPVFDGGWRHVTYGPPWTFLGLNSRYDPGGKNSGGEEWATRRWVSPVSGSARAVGHLAMSSPNTLGTGVFARIYLNGNLIYEHFLAGTDATGADYSVDFDLQSGDIVDFSIAPNGAEYFDNVYFSNSVLLVSARQDSPSIIAPANTASGQRGFRR